mmetsp:Transcript_19152/g.61635  ORF Transcript_19152/g.61635 Transcript_19152/m.61635 type:complete len:332 (+) Transcript_19152:2263-3258(+)
MRFAFYLLPRFKSTKTVGQHISLARSRHKLYYGIDFGDAAVMPRLAACLKTLSDLFPIRRRERHPITIGHFRRWRRRVPWDAPDTINVTAAFELAFCGLLRSTEWCPKSASAWRHHPYRLSRAHVDFVPSVAEPEYCRVHVTPAKAGGATNHYNNRNPLVLPFDATAPVNACRALRTLFQKDPVPKNQRASTPLFRHLNKRGCPAIAYREFLNALRRLIAVDPQVDPSHYGLHSFRIGGATALLAAGCPPHMIQAMGRWSSDIYILYCRSNFDDLVTWQLRLGPQHANPTERTALLRRYNIPTQGTDLWSPALETDIADPADDGADFDALL